MLRRTFLICGLSLIAVAAGSAAGLTRTSVTAAGPFPWTPTSSTPTPVVSANQVSAPGGLGNTRTDFEETYGTPTGLQGTMVAFRDGAVAATFDGSRATRVLITFAKPVDDLDRARAQVKPLAPPDATLVGTMQVGANRVADLFHSARLATQVVAPLHTPSGQYVVVYLSDNSGAIKQVLLSVGRVPPDQS